MNRVNNTVIFIDEERIHPKTMYFGINRDNIPLLGWDDMLHTLVLWRFMFITFTKADTEGSEIDADVFVFSAILLMLTLRREAFAQQLTM